MADILDELERYAKEAMPNYPNDICSRAKAEIERLRADRQATIVVCMMCVPTIWLDPLLTGPKKIADFADGPAIERLLLAIRGRIAALDATPKASTP